MKRVLFLMAAVIAMTAMANWQPKPAQAFECHFVRISDGGGMTLVCTL